MFLPLTVTLVSAPGLLVFLVARSSFFTWATAGIMPLNKRALNRIRFISDVVPFPWSMTRSFFFSMRSEITSDHLSILHDEPDPLEFGYVGDRVAVHGN